MFPHLAASSVDPSILIAVRYSCSDLPTRRWFRTKALTPTSNTMNVLSPGNIRRLADSLLLGPLELAVLLEGVSDVVEGILQRHVRV
jgi:hypothetical protein